MAILPPTTAPLTVEQMDAKRQAYLNLTHRIRNTPHPDQVSLCQAVAQRIFAHHVDSYRSELMTYGSARQIGKYETQYRIEFVSEQSGRWVPFACETVKSIAEEMGFNWFSPAEKAELEALGVDMSERSLAGNPRLRFVILPRIHATQVGIVDAVQRLFSQAVKDGDLPRDYQLRVRLHAECMDSRIDVCSWKDSLSTGLWGWFKSIFLGD